jgi:predicted TIM-barrel fold metal-dependent hydrolase
MDQAGCARACVVAIADFIPNADVVAFTREHRRRLIPIGSINPAKYTSETDVSAAVEELASSGCAGLKLHPRLNGFDPRDRLCIVAIRAAAQYGLVVYLDTLFRQPAAAMPSAPEIVDDLAHSCPDGPIVLLHGGGASLLEMSEVVRMHPRLVLDVSHTLLRYAGSSLDLDLRFVFQTLDRRLVLGSDFPEYTPQQAVDRFEALAAGVGPEKRANILFNNLVRLFDPWDKRPPG